MKYTEEQPEEQDKTYRTGLPSPAPTPDNGLPSAEFKSKGNIRQTDARKRRRVYKRQHSRDTLGKHLLRENDALCRREGYKLLKCKTYANKKNGDVQVNVRSCRSRFCNYCAMKRESEVRGELNKVLQISIKRDPVSKLHFITWTIRHKKENSCKTELARLKYKIRHLFRKTEVKNLVVGRFVAYEYTKNGDFHHHHAHGVLQANCSSTYLARVIKKYWHDFIRIRPLKNGYEDLNEVVGYCWKVSKEQSKELIYATRGVCMFLYGGTFRTIKKELKIAEKEEYKRVSEDEVVPTPPTLVDEDTGEDYEDLMPDGRYTHKELYLHHMRNNKCATQMLKIIEYRLKYGLKYEQMVKMLIESLENIEMEEGVIH
jgi:hypothetical protein